MPHLKLKNEKICARLFYESGAEACILYDADKIDKDSAREDCIEAIQEAIMQDHVFLTMQSPLRASFEEWPADYLLLRGLRAISINKLIGRGPVITEIIK